MTPEREAEAFAVWKRHGERSALFVDEHIDELALNKDQAGIERWQEIGAALDTLMRGACP